MKLIKYGMLALVSLAAGLIAGPAMGLLAMGFSVCAVFASAHLPMIQTYPRSIFETRRAGLA
ncbi:hypothetical protein A3718_12130 [Erythrobacter sp. HI0019]|uniref:hypothetical protein n=1 Tax=unclassified Erythrobacter TaxID=2633097 RepID=UPI0007B98B66|nr:MULTISPECIES: hypothetical protein [unclassified Erythrobacter]KZX92311.1 hypothetical protein A3718_12130 [Erythrobacter sp. HI0019]KZY08077.1 hypothetical protein A3723_13845 [Erythrobacter sp. HI0028]